MENKKFNHAEKGQSLVELALTLLIILTLLAGAVDLGMAFFSYVALRDAAQEGALYGSLNPTDSSGIVSRVRQSSSSPINLSDVSNVTVSYNYRLSMPFIGSILGSTTIPITARVIDTILNPACAP